MTRDEFPSIIRYLEAATGKPSTLEQAEVYFDLLCDLPNAAVQEAARRAVLEHKYPTMPPVGLIRQHAIALTGERTPGPEAWRLALACVDRFGMAVRGDEQQAHESRALATLPADVANALRCYGWKTLCDANDDELGIVQTQFLKAYDTLGRRDERKALMPPMTTAAAALVSGIGREIEEKPMPRLTR